jgi:uncharacterized damage-inducible protein DinB
MKVSDYVRQFAYDEWANQEVLRTIRSSGADERSLALLAHILSAERLWLERLQQIPQSSPVWPNSTLENCASELEERGTLWREYLTRSTDVDLTQAITYKNSKGEPWTIF